jgi:hypothetical protein
MKTTRKPFTAEIQIVKDEGTTLAAIASAVEAAIAREEEGKRKLTDLQKKALAAADAVKEQTLVVDQLAHERKAAATGLVNAASSLR